MKKSLVDLLGTRKGRGGGYIRKFGQNESDTKHQNPRQKIKKKITVVVCPNQETATSNQKFATAFMSRE